MAMGEKVTEFGRFFEIKGGRLKKHGFFKAVFS